MATLTQFPNGVSFASDDTPYADSTGFVGAVTGAVTGDVTGNLTGSVKRPVTAVSADGTVTLVAYDMDFVITKGGVAAITLPAPTATTHDGVHIRFTSNGAHAHTVTHGGTLGFNSGGTASDVATAGGAAGDTLECTAYQGVWYAAILKGFSLG